MSKVAYFTILSIVLLAAITVINIRGVDAGEATKFVPVSVLAQDQADYGVDEDAHTIPAVSPDIIEDKIEDMQSASTTVRTIEYTTLPARDLVTPAQNTNQTQNVTTPQDQQDPANNETSVTDPGQNQNQANNGNGQDKAKNKDKNKDKNGSKDNKGNGAGNDTSTAKGQDTKSLKDK